MKKTVPHRHSQTGMGKGEQRRSILKQNLHKDSKNHTQKQAETIIFTHIYRKKHFFLTFPWILGYFTVILQGKQKKSVKQGSKRTTEPPRKDEAVRT